jgi:hypothetical protein
MHRRGVRDRREPNLPDVRKLRWLVPADVLRHLSNAVRSEYLCHVQQHVRHLPHAVRTTHVSGHVPYLRDPVQPGDMCDMPDPVQSGDLRHLPDPMQSAHLQDMCDLRRRHLSSVHARDLLQYMRTLLMRA